MSIKMGIVYKAWFEFKPNDEIKKQLVICYFVLVQIFAERYISFSVMSWVTRQYLFLDALSFNYIYIHNKLIQRKTIL